MSLLAHLALPGARQESDAVRLVKNQSVPVTKGAPGDGVFVESATEGEKQVSRQRLSFRR